jgi:hypothetical protein
VRRNVCAVESERKKEKHERNFLLHLFMHNTPFDEFYLDPFSIHSPIKRV